MNNSGIIFERGVNMYYFVCLQPFLLWFGLMSWIVKTKFDAEVSHLDGINVVQAQTGSHIGVPFLLAVPIGDETAAVHSGTLDQGVAQAITEGLKGTYIQPDESTPLLTHKVLHNSETAATEPADRGLWNLIFNKACDCADDYDVVFIFKFCFYMLCWYELFLIFGPYSS